MNNLEILYEPYIVNLFILPFDILSEKYDNNIYSWKKFESIFNSIYNIINDSDNDNELVKYYYFITFLFVNYTNYLNYISHPDLNNKDIYNFMDKLKFNEKIIKKIFLKSYNKNLKKILKISNIFFNFKNPKKINNDNINKYISEFIDNTHQMDKLYNLSNTSPKKILNIMVFRYIISNNINYENFHKFYLNKILNNNITNNILDFEHFMKLIPDSKKILDLILNSNLDNKNINFSINVSLNKVINFLINKHPKMIFEDDRANNKFILKNDKFGGKIVIEFNKLNNSNDSNISNTRIEFNTHQLNYSLIQFGISELKDFNFLKKSNTFIQIKLNSKNINDFSTLLDIIHIITIGIKTLESYPNDLYDCIYPIEYTNYYFDSFVSFFEFCKDNIKNISGYTKFIMDLVKYFYIYSYYDYYFYHSDSLVKTILENYNYKNNIFNDFITNLKNVLKVPNE